MSLIYIAGLSGSGKSTLVENLRLMGYESHDADSELCHWHNNVSHEIVEYPRDQKNRPAGWQDHHTFLLEEDLVISLADSSLKRNIYICGVAPNDLQMAAKYFEKVLFLNVSKETMIKRVTTRTNNKYGHDADQLAVITKWYESTVEKYKTYGAVFIDAEQPPDQVLANVLSLT
jgi:shikimate kinase